MLKGKTIILGVTGCIAAYKACEIVSSLRKKGADVEVIMTPHAARFVQPLSFETLSGNRVITDLFDRDNEFEVEHVALAKKADLFVVAPATANTIGKIAGGIADDMLTTTIMACGAPKVICPAMNTGMYENRSNLKNIEKLKKQGMHIVGPDEGRLACGDVGKGRMAEPELIVKTIEDILVPNPDYEGIRVLVTAGSTEEKIDGVRYITNHSSGKMGMAVAKAAAARGADVILVAGRMSVPVPDGFEKVVRVKSTADMLEAVMENYGSCSYVVMAAAPADYRVKNFSIRKIKAQEIELQFEKTPDISRAVGEAKGDRKLVIFSAETEDLIANARRKLEAKNADMVVANDVTLEGAGFNVDTNIVSIITRGGEPADYGLMPKTELAEIILDKMLELA